MNKAVLISWTSLLAAGCTDGRPTEPSASEQAQLGAALAGYQPSGPVIDCVNSRDLRGNRSFGEGAIVFDGPTRSTLYVNRPSGGCPELGFGRALVTHQHGSRLCSGDIADVFDTSTRTTYGSCAMGQFTPYRRVKG